MLFWILSIGNQLISTTCPDDTGNRDCQISTFTLVRLCSVFRLAVAKHIRQHHEQADHNAHIGGIEYSGSQGTDAHDHKIHHFALGNAVEQIADTSATDKAECNDLPGIELSAEQGVQQQSAQQNGRHDGEYNEFDHIGKVGAEAEESAGVFHKNQLKKPADDVAHRLVFQVLNGQQFRPAIQTDATYQQCNYQ